MENKSTIFGPPERALRRIPYSPCSKSRCPDPSASLYVSHCQIRSLPTLSSRTAGPSTQEERSTVRSAVTRPGGLLQRPVNSSEEGRRKVRTTLRARHL